MYSIKITNMKSAIASLVSLRNRLGQALSRCLEFFDHVFSKTPATRTVNKIVRREQILPTPRVPIYFRNTININDTRHSKG